MYGLVGDKTLPDKLGINYAANKTGGVLWYVSNCGSKYADIRIQYVQELKKHINVDIYGRCKKVGAKPDPCMTPEIKRIPGEERKCLNSFLTKYKFYLAFENAKCDWYITEKIIKCLYQKVLPIALGAPMDHYAKAMPKDSFLHVDNFTSPKLLADYIHYLDTHDSAYNKYMEWRTSHVGLYGFESGFACDLCERLWNPVHPKKHSVPFSKWFGDKENCIR